jgi:ribosome recycling factor
MAFDFSTLRQKYDQVIKLASDDLNNISTGRARPAMVEDVMVEVYGSRMALKELGSITAPDPDMIVIQPWDKSILDSVAKGIAATNRLNPVVDGQLIRIKVPALTGEQRDSYVKLTFQKIESAKQMMRGVRTDIKKEVEGQKGQPGVSEDDIKDDLEQLDKVTHEYTEKLDQIGKAKETELRTM